MTTKSSFELYFSRQCIDNAERNSCTKCIGVLGVVNSIEGCTNPRVDKDEIRFTYRNHRYIFPTPPKLTVIAQDYENGRIMKQDIIPWRETIKDPTFVERIAHRRRRKTKTKAKKVVVVTAKPRKRISRWGGRRVR